MRVKTESESNVPVLVAGKRTVAREVEGIAYKQLISRTQMDKYTGKGPLWYVLLEKVTETPHASGHSWLATRTRITTFRWAYTKKWARDQALEARKEGFKVVDITRGTITHPMNKFRGLE